MIFSILNDADRAKMLRIREGAEKSMFEPELIAPHETFAMDLEALKESGIPQPDRTGIRAIEVSNDQIKYVYEVYPDTGAQMFRDGSFLNDYQRALERIAVMATNAYILRTLRIPALHIDALWLHDKTNQDNDNFIVVRTMPGLERNRPYTRSQFFSIVKDAAVATEPGDDQSGG